MEGIDDQSGNAGRLKMRKHALPINPGALHHDLLDAVHLQPGDQSAHVALEPAELARLARHRAVLLADQDGDDVLHAMHVDAGNPLMNRFHNRPPTAKRKRARGFEWSGQDACAACATWANLPCVLQAELARQFGVRTVQMGPVSCRGVTAKLRATSCSKSPAPALYPNLAASTFHHWGRQLAVMMVMSGKPDCRARVVVSNVPVARLQLFPP